MEDLRNAKRLSNALKYQTNDAMIRQFARLLNYNVEQLQEDIDSLEKVLQDLKEEDE